jgi:hypothetical protein
LGDVDTAGAPGDARGAGLQALAHEGLEVLLRIHGLELGLQLLVVRSHDLSGAIHGDTNRRGIDKAQSQ